MWFKNSRILNEAKMEIPVMTIKLDTMRITPILKKNVTKAIGLITEPGDVVIV